MIDPENAIMKQSLATAQAKENDVDNAEAVTRSTDAPAAGGAAPFDFASMMSNPNFMTMGIYTVQ